MSDISDSSTLSPEPVMDTKKPIPDGAVLDALKEMK